MLSAKSDGRFIPPTELKQNIYTKQRLLDEAVERGIAQEIAKAAVQYQHVTQQSVVSDDVRYDVDEGLMELIIGRYSKKYRIGLVVANKLAARQAVELFGATEHIDSFIYPDELDAHNIYFSDFSLIVTTSKFSKLMMPGVDYVHYYRSAMDFEIYMKDPKPSWNYGYDDNDPFDPLNYVVPSLLMIVVMLLAWLLYVGLIQ